MGALKEFLPRYTIKDYEKWEGDWELIEGVPYAMSPSPYAKHQRISGLIFREIENQLEKCKKRCYVYQEVDWRIDNYTVVRPDLIVVCKKIEEYLTFPPEVIFEIVSKSTKFKDENIKYYLYEKEKVKYYALVYPEEKKMKVFELENEKYKLVFEGFDKSFTFNIKCPFSLNLSDIWKKV